MKTSLSILMALLISCSTLWSQEESKNSKTKKGTIIKVLSFNIYGGRTTKEDLNYDAVAQVIKKINPDLVAMQEVDYKVNRSKKVDLTTEIGSKTNMIPLFARAMYYDGGEYGEGVLSKLSFLRTRNVALPAISGQEPRSALEVVVELPSGDTIAFVGTHFAHEGEPGRVIQAKKINEVFSKNKYPTILAGDLNARPGSEPMNILEEMWVGTYDKENPEGTIPSHAPRSKIDYIMYYPKNRWRVIDKEVICDTYASDHCAYLVTIELLGE